MNAAIARLKITRVVIAHRLETILAADKVYVLNDGRLTDITKDMSEMRIKMRVQEAADAVQEDEE